MEKDGISIADQGALESINEDFANSIAYHERTFGDLERKAKYWLTFCLPAATAATAYIVSNYATANPAVLAATSGFLTSMLICIYHFSKSMRVGTFSGGSVLPENEQFKTMENLFLKGDGSGHIEHRRYMAEERLRAIGKNRKANNRKSNSIERGESVLFFGVPTSPIVAGVVAAFLHIVASKFIFVAIGALIALGIVFFFVPFFTRHDESS